jgi:hypothetical protein
MRSLKHVGKIKNTGAKVLVVFRTLPGESNMSLVLPTSTLPDQYHDALITLVESDQAQSTNELGEIMFIRRFPDGRPMLQAMQADNRMQKVTTSLVVMTPTLNDSIQLDELNVIIAQQKNCAIDDLAGLMHGARPTDTIDKVINQETQQEQLPEANTEQTTPLTDKDIAKSYRSQADSLYKEAARLRKQADELDPPQKKTVKSKETADV